MKAIVMTGYGSNEVVRLSDVAPPKMREEDVLIQVHAASVNPVDFKIRDGKLKNILKFSFPHIMGFVSACLAQWENQT